MATIYTVPNIPCALCFKAIKNALKEKLSIDDVVFRPLRKKIIIKISDDKNHPELHLNITQLLAELGHAPQKYSDLLQGIVGTLAGLFLPLLTMLLGPLPVVIMIPLAFFSTVLTLALGEPSYKKAWIELRTLTFSMDSLFAVSSAIALLVSIVSFWIPTLPMMFDMGLLMFGFRHLGQVIEESLAQESQLDINFSELLPKQVLVKQGTTFELRNLADIQVGDELQVAEKQTVPLDGECLNEHHSIYETALRGTSLPRKVNQNELLLSGMVVAQGHGPLRLRVTQSLERSNLSLLDQQIKDAQKGKQARYQLLADKVLQYFIPAVFVMAGVSGAVMACFFPWAIAIRAAVGVLVTACPCTLSLVVPLAVQMGMRKAGLQGAQFKDSDELQKAGEVDRVVFDLNGTLTTGKYEQVGEPVLFDSSINQQEFLKIVGALEKDSPHPIGKSLYDYSLKTNVAGSVAEKFQALKVEQIHSGVKGQINSESYVLGNLNCMKQLNIQLNGHRIPELAGGVASYLARGDKIVGYIVVKNPLRLDAPQVIKALHKLGKEVYICTGSDYNTAAPIAQQLGISVNNLLVDASDAKAKAQYIKCLQVDGHKVAMVGDSVNDSVAFEESHFGLAIDSVLSDSATQSRAGAVTRGDLLWPIVVAFAISKQTVAAIEQNLWLNFGYNIIAVLMMGGGFASCGMMVNPSLGVVLMIAQMCLILGNSWRFQRQGIEHLKEPLKPANTPVDGASMDGLTSRPVAINSPEKNHSIVYKSLYAHPNATRCDTHSNLNIR